MESSPNCAISTPFTIVKPPNVLTIRRLPSEAMSRTAVNTASCMSGVEIMSIPSDFVNIFLSALDSLSNFSFS